MPVSVQQLIEAQKEKIRQEEKAILRDEEEQRLQYIALSTLAARREKHQQAIEAAQAQIAQLEQSGPIPEAFAEVIQAIQDAANTNREIRKPV